MARRSVRRPAIRTQRGRAAGAPGKTRRRRQVGIPGATRAGRAAGIGTAADSLGVARRRKVAGRPSTFINQLPGRRRRVGATAAGGIGGVGRVEGGTRRGRALQQGTPRPGIAGGIQKGVGRGLLGRAVRPAARRVGGATAISAGGYVPPPGVGKGVAGVRRKKPLARRTTRSRDVRVRR